MATLEKIRGKAGLLVTVIGVALFAFIVGDLLNSGNTFFRSSENKVAVVNGKKIPYETYIKRVEEMNEALKIQYGASAVNGEMTAQVNQNALDGLIAEQLLLDAADKVGMDVPQAEMADLLQGENVSPLIRQLFTNPETGAFDRNLLMGFLQNVLSPEAATSPELASYRTFWLYMEKMIKQQRLLEKYNTLITRAVYPNKIELADAYNGNKKSVDFAYAMQAFSSIPDDAVNVSDAELKKRYNQLKSSLQQEMGRVVKYMVVNIDPSAEDFTAAEEKINSFKEEFATMADVTDLINLNADEHYINAAVALNQLAPEIREFAQKSAVGEVSSPQLAGDTYSMLRLVDRKTAPDSVRVRHILLPLQDEMTTLKQADSLLQVLRQGGSFETLAAQYSADTQSSKKGGELGWFTEIAATGMIGEDFSKAIFGAQGSEYFMVKMPSFVQIAQVEERTAPVAKANVAAFIVKVAPGTQTFNNIYNKVNQYIALNNTMASFEANADSSGYAVLTDYAVGSSDNELGTLKDARQVVKWAFNNKKGAISEIFTLDDKFVVAAVAQEIEPGIVPFDQAKAQLTAQLLNEKKGEKIQTELKSKNLSTLQAYAQAMGASIDTANFVTFNTTRISGLGDEPAVVGLLPNASLNGVSGPVVGKNGVYVLSVFNSTENEQPFDAATEKQKLESSRQYMFNYQIMDVLRKNGKVEDFRYRFF